MSNKARRTSTRIRKAMTRPHFVESHRAKISKEQWVIDCVTRIVGSSANVITGDDIASDIILDLLNEGGFSWDENEIEKFCRRKVYGVLLQLRSRKEISHADLLPGSSEDQLLEKFISVRQVTQANQETCYYAHEAIRLLDALPSRHKAALSILAGGGNPIDVAQEMHVEPWEAIVLIKEARSYLDRVSTD